MCFSDYMPFVHCRQGERERFRVDYKAIAQGVIVSILTAGLVMWSTQKVIITELEAIKKEITQVRDKQDQFTHDFYIPRR